MCSIFVLIKFYDFIVFYYTKFKKHFSWQVLPSTLTGLPAWQQSPGWWPPSQPLESWAGSTIFSIFHCLSTSINLLRHVKSTTSFTILIRFKRRTLYLIAAFSLAFFHLSMGLYTFVKTQDYFQELDSEIIEVWVTKKRLISFDLIVSILIWNVKSSFNIWNRVLQMFYITFLIR